MICLLFRKITFRIFLVNQVFIYILSRKPESKWRHIYFLQRAAMIHWCVAKLIYFFSWTEYQYWNNISLYYKVKIWQIKKALYLSVNVFSMKVLIGDTIFYVSYWRRDHHFTWSSESREGLAACSGKAVPSFLSYFKTLSIGLATGIEPATFPSAVKRSIDWAYPPTVKFFCNMVELN